MNGHKEAAEAAGYIVSVGEHTLRLEAAPRGAVERSVRQM